MKKFFLFVLVVANCLIPYSCLANTVMFTAEKTKRICHQEFCYKHISPSSCYERLDFRSGKVTLDPWNIQIDSKGNLSVPLTIKIDPKSDDFESDGKGVTKTLTLKYLASTQQFFENDVLITNDMDAIMYKKIYDDMLSMRFQANKRYCVVVYNNENRKPFYDGYGRIKYYVIEGEKKLCDVANSRKDNVVYLIEYYFTGERYWPVLNEYDDLNATYFDNTFMYKKNSLGLWKRSSGEGDDKGKHWWDVDNQAEIEKYANALGVTGTGVVVVPEAGSEVSDEKEDFHRADYYIQKSSSKYLKSSRF